MRNEHAWGINEDYSFMMEMICSILQRRGSENGNKKYSLSFVFSNSTKLFFIKLKPFDAVKAFNVGDASVY